MLNCMKRNARKRSIMAQWSSLYLHTSDTSSAAAALQAALANAGYTLYDPFGLMPGRAYPQAVKTFIAPLEGEWTRLIIAPDTLLDEQLIIVLSRLALTLALTLEGEQALIAVYRDGQKTETVEA